MVVRGVGREEEKEKRKSGKEEKENSFPAPLSEGKNKASEPLSGRNIAPCSRETKKKTRGREKKRASFPLLLSAPATAAAAAVLLFFALLLSWVAARPYALPLAPFRSD